MRSSRRFVSCCSALVFALALLALPALAQQNRWASSTPEELARKQTERMKEKLGLTAEQLPKVEAINLEAAKKTKALFAGAQAAPAEDPKAANEIRKNVREIQQSKDTALKGVLTSDQYAKYEVARDEALKRIKERGRERRPGAGE